MTKRSADPAPPGRWPLSPAVFHVLVALAAGDKHGYAILKDVRRRSGGAVTLNVGTLYAVLKRLEQDGLIEESDERPDPALDDERRRYYRITTAGQAVARADVARLERAVAMARAVHLAPRAGRV
jgi:DNA-binding PadR family transcriptional regulator